MKRRLASMPTLRQGMRLTAATPIQRAALATDRHLRSDRITSPLVAHGLSQKANIVWDKQDM